MNPLESYSVDIRSILEELGATVAVDAEVVLGPIQIGTERFVPLAPAHLDAHLTATGTGIVLGGTLSLTVQSTCSRCLREFPLEVTAEIEGFYIDRGQEAELPEEQEFGYLHEGSVDIADALMAALALELPFAPLHAEDCPGICAQCGADLVEGPCSCGPDVSKSPFASLSGLFPEPEGK